MTALRSTHRPVRLACLGLVVVTVGGLVGCGGDDDDVGLATPTAIAPPPATVSDTAPSPDTTSRAADETSTSIPLPTLGTASAPPQRPTDATRLVTLRGTVTDGATDDCVTLVTPGGRFALIGDLPADVTAGATIEIDAVPAPNMLTACDGTPVRVVAVRMG